MATLAPGSRITRQTVEDEIARLRRKWTRKEVSEGDDILNEVLGADKIARLDLFDRVQVAEVLRVCRRSRNMSEAGGRSYAVSRQERKIKNDSDRMRKYLARFGLHGPTSAETEEPRDGTLAASQPI